MKVFVSDIIRKHDKYGSDYTLIDGRLHSGLAIIVKDVYYNLQGYEGQHIEMLLSVLRSPYLELQRGIQNQIFASEEFYSVELIDELLEKKGHHAKDYGEGIILTGEYINSYIVPEKWAPLIKPELFKIIPKKLSALRTYRL